MSVEDTQRGGVSLRNGSQPDGRCALWPYALLLYFPGDRGRVAGIGNRGL